MNLVLSGPIDVTLRNWIVTISRPRQVVSLHARADRLEGVDDAPAVRAQVAAFCDAARVDHAYIEEGVRFSDFKLLAMDMDSTLITIECIDEIADFAGKKAEVAAITEAAMRGEMDFAESLLRRVATLAGLNVDVLKRVFDERLALTSGANTIINLAKTAGTRVILLSGGFSYFAQRLKQQLGLDEAYANTLEVHDNILTGRIVGRVIDADAKAEIVRQHLGHLESSPSEAIVIGDGANDIEMMNCVEFSVAYHARQKVKAAAHLRIDYGSLSVLADWLVYSRDGDDSAFATRLG